MKSSKRIVTKFIVMLQKGTMEKGHTTHIEPFREEIGLGWLDSCLHSYVPLEDWISSIRMGEE